ncbi:MAG: class B sortase [Eubacterium sp.]|nr:class B sortase [Eubacterium sp.]
MQISKKILIFISLLLICILTFSIFQLLRIYTEKEKSISQFKGLKNIIENTSVQTENENPQYLKLKEKNSDFIGWLTIDGTNIDYPVMQNTNDSEFYLKHNFDKEKDRHGIPFAASSSSIPNGDNIIIFGHSMKDGTMFSELQKFISPKFCEENHSIMFNTFTTSNVYDVIMVFKISESDTEKFPYYTYTSFDNITANNYLSMASQYSIWNNNKTINNDTKLLTLSTCEYTLNNGRLVIIAKKRAD